MPSKLLRDAEEKLINSFCIGRWLYEADRPGRKLIVTCTYRSVAEQQVLYAQGRTTPGSIVTQIDGVTKKGNHNYWPSRALDFAVLVNGVLVWTDAEYRIAGPYFVSRGLGWGGNWTTFKDLPHLELV